MRSSSVSEVSGEQPTVGSRTESGGFCPSCGAEYRPTYSICSDCGVPLVPHLPDPPEPAIPYRFKIAGLAALALAATFGYALSRPVPSDEYPYHFLVRSSGSTAEFVKLDAAMHEVDDLCREIRSCMALGFGEVTLDPEHDGVVIGFHRHAKPQAIRTILRQFDSHLGSGCAYRFRGSFPPDDVTTSRRCIPIGKLPLS